MTGTSEGAQKANETRKENQGSQGGSQNKSQQGHNLSEEDRRKGGEHSHGGGRKE